MKKKIAVILLALSTIGLSGCTQQLDQVNPLEEQVTTLQKENENLAKQVESLTKQIDELMEQNTKLQEEIQVLDEEQYTLYTRDVDSWEIVELETISLSKDETIKEKLQQIANEISKTCFENLEIKVEEIKTIGNKEIATINLKDNEEELNWMSNYFQGSTGAGVTLTILEESLLQRKSNYPWIDGIELVYNGETLSSTHIELGNILYR